jgi:hypothetical protein
MGLERIVSGAASPLAAVKAKLDAAGLGCVVVMIDGALVLPTAPLPSVWRDVRVRAAQGTVTLLRRGDDLALVIFGNADPGLVALQERMAAALSGP